MTQSLNSVLGLTPKPDQRDKLKPFSQWKGRDTGTIATVFCVAKDGNPMSSVTVVVYADFAHADQQSYLETSVFLQNFEFAEQIQSKGE